jgi:2,4-didehydro-3-deoxy-L-rhamnonate hydrolase
MRLCSYSENMTQLIAQRHNDGTVTPLAEISEFYHDPSRFIERPRESLPAVSPVTFRPPVPPSARVPSIGLNYRAHAEEGGLPVPPVPVVFARYAASLAVDGDEIPILDPQTDWEGELAVVLGRPLFRASRQAAAEAILGYAVFNDVSARTFQFESGQYTMGKNGDRSGILGDIVTADEAGDPAAGWRLTTRVNEAVTQDADTSDMIFDVPSILVYLSKAMTLLPGDVIATGTPSGVGFACSPQRFLNVGDRVEVSISGLGTIRNRIIAPGDWGGLA